MSYWKDLVTTALVGTERQAPPAPEAGSPLGDALAELLNREPEQFLLAAAGAASLYRRIGTVPSPDENPLPTPDLPEEQPVCSDRSADHLSLMLSGTHSAVLEEWLVAARLRGVCAPPAVLPDLLQAGRQSRALRSTILEVAGGRGRWLANQNPEWSYLAVDEDEETTWETAPQAARQVVFGRLRASNPGRARELLAGCWAQETADDRAAFLGAFRTGLYAADEPFLEAALDDRSKVVRGVAADLLARLPASAYVGRMWERVQPLVSVHTTSGLLGIGRKLQVQLTLPAVCDPAMVRDGIEPKVPAHVRDLGERSWWLLQMLGAVSPARWSELAGARAPELLDAATKTEWRELLVEAWSMAAERCGNVEWAEVLLLLPGDWSEARRALMQVLPEPRREAVAMHLLNRDPDPFVTRFAGLALESCRHAWSDQLARLVLSRCQHRVARLKGHDYYLAQALPQFALHINPALASEAGEGWNVPDDLQAQWARPIGDLTALLHFRREMLEEIQR